ncbi:DUF2813 domain-containing protein, partial [Listeria monocytogenes]|nr:DUF2813 domain-containing protein [Listeria monocytogenes]
MILQKMILKNFRGYKECEINFSDKITSLIGKNDVGKSTILEALDIFFSESPQKLIDSRDLNIYSKENYIDIVVEFKLDADDDLLTLDSTAVTSFTKECLLNSSKNLELILRINIDKDATSVSV